MRFGTDGIRGVANTELTVELALALGQAAARSLVGDRFLIANDSRLSSSAIESALAAGLASSGAHVEMLGVMPTPALAAVSAAENVPAAMISASHNPAADNGVKLFAAGGHKLSDAAQVAIEAAIAEPEPATSRPVGGDVGVVSRRAAASEIYVERVLASVAGTEFGTDLRVVLDCANGAASGVGPEIMARLGVDAVVINHQPDGLNINHNCGSTHLDVLADSVRHHRADLGVALDGDADRMLSVTSDGTEVDGDQVMAMLALDRHGRGELPNDTVVVTVMSNLGFRLAMEAKGITVVETPVGDRHVLEALAAGGHGLGGEQSGHIILPGLATTGDGLLSTVQLLALIARTTKEGSIGAAAAFSQLVTEAMERLPQVLVNAPVSGGDAAQQVAELNGPIAEAERRLGSTGRVLVRPSGTEPLIRVMAEARELTDAQAAVDHIVSFIN